MHVCKCVLCAVCTVFYTCIFMYYINNMDLSMRSAIWLYIKNGFYF